MGTALSRHRGPSSSRVEELGLVVSTVELERPADVPTPARPVGFGSLGVTVRVDNVACVV